jgi:hypothetical protein
MPGDDGAPAGKQGGRHQLQRWPSRWRCVSPGMGWHTASCSDGLTWQQAATERTVGHGESGGAKMGVER